MPSYDAIHRLEASAVDWPAAETLPHTGQLQARLAALPDELSGISLKVLKETALPSWKDDDPAALARLLPSGSAAATDDTMLREQLQALPLPATDPSVQDDPIADALLAARVLRGLGGTDRAEELLLAAATAVRLRVEGTFFALWLLEVAEQWLDGAASEPLRCRMSAELGGLVAQVGDIREGIRLIRAGSDGLFALARRARDRAALLATAWQWKYEAGKWGLLSDSTSRKQAIAELKDISQDRRGAPEGSETWFHAGFELIAAEASPDQPAANAEQAKQLRQRLDKTDLPPAARDRLTAHAHQALGLVLAFGNNRFLHTQAREELEIAASLFEASHDWANWAQTLDALGRICSQLGDHTKADEHLLRSMELKQQLKDLRGLGAYFNARAESFLRRGRPLQSVPLYEADLALLRHTPGTSKDVELQNLGMKAAAYLAPYQDPFQAEDRAAATTNLQEAARILKEYDERMAGQPDMEVSQAYYLMHQAALARLQARWAGENERPGLLAQGEAWARRSIQEFQEARHLTALVNAEIHLAGLRVDQALLLKKDSKARKTLLDEAHQTLEAAEKHRWDSYEGAYLELEWAWYYQAVGDRPSANNHMASARHHAQACGNASIKVSAEAVMGVHLRGPTGQDRWEVILPPGEALDIPVSALDWRGRPLAGYALNASVVLPSEPKNLKVNVRDSRKETDSVGQASFTVEAPSDTKHGTVSLEVRDHNVLREARAEIHVQPFGIELDPRLPSDLLKPEDRVVLRHLFGPRFLRIDIRKKFGGLGGALVLLVKPVLALPASLGKTSPSAEEEGLRAQFCLVKLGDRRAILEEIACYEQHVKDLLSANVARIASWTVWKDRAGIRMSLAGDHDWDRALQEMDWLFQAPPVEVHHLLDDIFGRDLGACWHSNGSAREGTKRLHQVYGRQLPVLLTLREPAPADGLLRDKPRDMIWTRVAEGLRPPGEQRSLEKGNTVYLGELEIVDWKWKRSAKEWEYELASVPSGLRVAFRTQLPPQYLDPDAMADKLAGQRRHVVGIIEHLGFDRLFEVLQACRADYPYRPDEEVVLSGDGTSLHIRTAGQKLSLPNPLFHLHDFLELPLPHWRSIIHGDLHVKNVIVSPRGMPYYIDFSEAGIGPTLFDFIKHEVGLWDWNLASPPPKAPQCTLADSLCLMHELTDPDNRFPAPFALPRCLQAKKQESAETMWLAKFYQCIGTLRTLAKQHSAAPDKSLDYFAPLCVYAAGMLRWCKPRDGESADEKAARARRGVFLTTLSGMLLERGLAGVAVP